MLPVPIQSASATATGRISVTLPDPPSVGNSLIAVIGTAGDQGTGTSTGGGGGTLAGCGATWTLLASYELGPALEVWLGVGCDGVDATVTAQGRVKFGIFATVTEYPGVLQVGRPA